MEISSLYKAFEGKFLFGNIISPTDFDCAATLEAFKHHYNAVTAENAMKPVYISPAKGEYNFDQADQIVNWANENDIEMIGHTLIWHGQSAPWLNKNPDGTVVTRAEAKANLETFIKTYASRYSGRIYSWDVINEVFRDDTGEFSGDWRNHLRRETDNPNAVGHWYLAYANGANADLGETGCDYIFDAFYFARKYDPCAVLYCNEYNEEQPIKRECLAQMVEEINTDWQKHPHYDGRLLIEGIGMQFHCNFATDLALVRQSLERFAKTGARISATELDITFGSKENPAVSLTEEQNKQQVEMYKQIFEMFLEFKIERVTMWAKNDGQSWRSWGSPVLFDGEGNAKDAYNAVLSASTQNDKKE